MKWTEANIREKIYYGACFSAQQSAEKALKAFLIYKKGRFGKIHDLVSLLGQCTKADSSFTRLKKKVAKISRYYIQSRYPDIGDIDRFTYDESHEAFEIAVEVLSFVNKLIGKSNK